MTAPPAEKQSASSANGVGARQGGLGRFWPRPPAERIIPFVLLVAVIVAIGAAQPRALSYNGLSLILIGALPVVLATMAQLFVMAAGDIDLGIGALVALVAAIVATFFLENPLLGIGLLCCVCLGYLGMGVLISVRRIPSLIVTFGMGSVWLGIALLVRPTPGGQVPETISNLVHLRMPAVPMPILAFALVAFVGWFLLTRTRLGVQMRAVGANPESARRAGISVLGIRVLLYFFSALCAILAGLALAGTTGSGDANAGASLILPTVAAVIVGGGSFTGGRVDPIGAVTAAVAISLIGSLLAFMNISAAYSSAVEGCILILAVGLRVLTGGDVGLRRLRLLPRKAAS